MIEAERDSTDNFRSFFKYYKRRNPLPDLTNVIDFRNIDRLSRSQVVMMF